MSVASVGKPNLHDLPHAIDATLVSDGCHHLHSVLEIPPHPICTPQIPPSLGGVRFPSGEVEDSGVFQEPANHTDDFDVVAESRDARSQQAEPSNNQLNLDSGSRGPIEGLDDLRVFQLVHLGPDSGGFPDSCMFCLFVDETKKSRLHGLRGQQDVIEFLLA